MAFAVVVDLYISAEEYLKWYSHSAQDVYTTARDGRSVRFPAKILQRFVTREGIKGSFLITFDETHKFQDIVRL